MKLHFSRFVFRLTVKPGRDRPSTLQVSASSSSAHRALKRRLSQWSSQTNQQSETADFFVPIEAPHLQINLFRRPGVFQDLSIKGET